MSALDGQREDQAEADAAAAGRVLDDPWDGDEPPTWWFEAGHTLEQWRRVGPDDDDVVNPELGLRGAARLAGSDWAQDWDTDADRSEWALATAIRYGLHLGVGRDAWVDYGDELSAAYRVVLEATDAEVEELR